MKKIAFIMAALMLASAFAGCSMLPSAPAAEEPAAEEPAFEYQYKTAEEAKTMIEGGETEIIIDIQPQEYFDQGHLPGSVATFAYPADTDELLAKLEPTLETVNADEAPVLVVGLGGKTGAENAVNYYIAQGVAAERLFILEGGAMSWPYDELKWSTLDYQYITPDEYVKNVEDEVTMMVIDVRQPEYFNAGHLPGAIATSSYPNNTKEEWDSLDALLDDINACVDPIVIVCMGGKSGATNAINHYATKGVDPRKFLILEGGGSNWPYADMLEKTPNFQYITADEMVAKMQNGDDMLILSVQTKENYRESGHLPGSVPTYAYPADTPELRENLEDELDKVQEATGDIIVVCHGGKLGATNSITYYVNKGIDESKFFILEGGIAGWPYPDMLEYGRGGEE